MYPRNKLYGDITISPSPAISERLFKCRNGAQLRFQRDAQYSLRPLFRLQSPLAAGAAAARRKVLRYRSQRLPPPMLSDTP